MEFGSIYWGKMGQILLASNLPKETVEAIIALKKHKYKCSVTESRHRLLWHCSRCYARGHISSIPVLYLADYILWWSLDNSACSKYIHQGRIPGTRLEQAAGGIGLYTDAAKKEYLCFNQRDSIYTLNGCSLKQVDKFTDHGSSMTSTEIVINSRKAKACTAMVIWKSDLSDKIKRNFSMLRLYTYYCMGAPPIRWLSV